MIFHKFLEFPATQGIAEWTELRETSSTAPDGAAIRIDVLSGQHLSNFGAAGGPRAAI